MPVYVGVDFHVKSQTVCWCDSAEGVIHQRTLDHRRDDIAAFYRQWTAAAIVGVEASGYAQWFHRLIEACGHRLLVGDAFAIRKCAQRRQKNDRRDAALLLDLLIKNEFPAVHRPAPASRDVLFLLRHRQRLVHVRTLQKNTVHAVALNHRVARGPSLFTARGRAQLAALPLSPAEQCQLRDGSELMSDLNRRIGSIEAELERIAEADPRVSRLRTHPGVGRLTALALVHALDPITRFATARKLTAYCGLDPQEESSGDCVRFRGISKQGNRLLRTLLVEAAWTSIRPEQDPLLRSFYFRLAAHKPSGVAIVAVARKLAVRLYRMWCENLTYDEFRRRGRDARRAR